MTARTLFDKIWASHVIASTPEGDILHVDRHYLHDLGGAPALHALAQRGLPVRAPHLTLAVADHVVATNPGRASPIPEVVVRLVDALEQGCCSAHIRYLAPDDPAHGIVHVIGPELGLTLPGMLVVCCDSHTCTHGALGAIGFGIGSSEVTHVLATQTIVQRKPRQMRLCLRGSMPPNVTAKDVALATVATLGAAGGVGYAVEYTGQAVAAMGLDARMTLCNLAVEFGAKIALIAPDARTAAWLQGRPHAPAGALWQQAMRAWQSLYSDPEARCRAALAYMALPAGASLLGLPIDRVFIGSCSNARLDDLRAAAQQLRGRRVPDHVTAWIVPGSAMVKRQAEADGLARAFTAAGWHWREPGCSMCLAANGESAAPGERVVATSNRNFVGRQGRGVRTHLASPATAAACAMAGVIAAPEG